MARSFLDSIFPCASQFVGNGIVRAKNNRVVEASAILGSGSTKLMVANLNIYAAEWKERFSAGGEHLSDGLVRYGRYGADTIRIRTSGIRRYGTLRGVYS